MSRTRKARVRTWAGTASSSPRVVEHPTTSQQVLDVLVRAREAGRTVKAIGSGHSFTSIAMTDGDLVDVSALSGVLAVDGTRVRLGAGTSLHQLPGLLGPLGLALQNMGDIDRQTVAGATSTGTHGTGLTYGGLATRITGGTLATPGGLVEVGPDLLPAVQVGLGAMGIWTEIEIDCVPAFRMRAHEYPDRFDPVLDHWVERVGAHDHVEAYWWPHTDWMSVKENTRLPADDPTPSASRFGRWVEEELVGNGAGRLVTELGHRVPALVPRINDVLGRLFANGAYVDESHRVFTSPRRIRFRECEYALPLEALPSAVRELRALVERRGWHVSFPVELRCAAADDTWLSTAYGRRSGYVAVHCDWRQDHRPYFTEAEAIFRAHDGRPHWGKLHTLEADDLRELYPRFDDVRRTRDLLDPDRVLANDYTRRVLGG